MEIWGIVTAIVTTLIATCTFMWTVFMKMFKSFREEHKAETSATREAVNALREATNGHLEGIRIVIERGTREHEDWRTEMKTMREDFAKMNVRVSDVENEAEIERRVAERLKKHG